MDMQQIERALLEIIQSYAGQLPGHQLKDMAELVRAGEPGIAFENLCTQLDEYDITVDAGMFDKMSAIGGTMGLDSAYWANLKIGP